MYKRKQKIWRGNTTHNEKHHNRCIKSLRQQVKCPFCKKRYSSLESLLIDAKLKELKSTWIQCECPQKPQQITDKETWIYITQENEKRKGDPCVRYIFKTAPPPTSFSSEDDVGGGPPRF